MTELVLLITYNSLNFQVILCTSLIRYVLLSLIDEFGKMVGTT